MFDTMTLTKVGGALCGALLVFLLLNWASDTIYSTETAHGEHAKAAYVIEVEGEAAAAVSTADETSSIGALVAAADAAKGAKVFSKCKACHKIEDGVNGVGPYLFGVVDRDIGSATGYGYSPAMLAMDGNWTIEHLNGFLTKPKTYLPGTKMGFSGLKKESDRANLIAYLQTLGN